MGVKVEGIFGLGTVRVDVRKKFFPMRVVKYQNRFLREVLDAPFLDTFRARLVRFWATWSS